MIGLHVAVAGEVVRKWMGTGVAKTSADIWYRPKVMVQYVEAEIKKKW